MLIPLVLVATSACMTGPRPVSSPAGDYLSANQPTEVWVTTRTGTQILVMGPRVITDTVFGWSADGQELILAVSDIQEVRARRMDTFRTALIPATAIIAGAAVVFLVSNDNTQAGNSPSDCEAQEEECDLP